MLISFSTLPTMQKYLYFASEELADRGFEVTTVGSTKLQIPYVPGENNLVVPTSATPRPSIQSARLARKSLDTVIGRIHATKPDVIHFVNKHVWNYLLMQRLRLRRLNVKWVHTFHDPIGHEGDSIQRGVIAYHKAVQRSLDAVVVHSTVAHTQVLEVLRPPCPVIMAPLGVTRWKEYQAVDSSESKNVLVFGRLNRYKGCEMYPEIFDEVHRLDPSIRITVAGQPSNDLPSGLLERIAHCPNVRLEGRFIEEHAVDRFFRKAALVLTPYTSMTQSGVLLDAFSNSRTVLAFQIGGMKEFLPADAPTVSCFDTREYARSIVEFVNDPIAQARAGRNAWEFGRARFTPASMAAELARTYDRVLAGTGQTAVGNA